MGDNQRSEEYQPSGYGGVSWQDMAPSPGMPILFTEQNATPQPHSPLYFSEYYEGLDEIFHPKTQGHADDSVQPIVLRNHPPLDCGAGSRQERVFSPEIPPPRSSLLLSGPISLDEMFYQQTQEQKRFKGHASVQPTDVLAFWYNSIPSPSLPPQGDQLPMQSYVWPGPSSSNQLLDTLSNSQNPSLRFNQPQNHQTEEKPLSKDQKYRQRLKAKQKVKDDYVEMLEHQSLMKDKEIALLKSEIKNKNEEITLLQSMVEMLREENASINYDNLPIH
ncbi:hypothetical protein V6N11_064291 [Hibiscus sabdariffa]|uniref:BZIP domain-containing protein n=1 Tax=Hibiscus sabdariffa TaxID=183260 RepID=A0ABR2PN73_9ROSI